MTPVTSTTQGSRHKPPEVKEIPVSRLMTDERVQRALIPTRVTSLAEILDLDSIGIITVSQRSPKELVIIDGQHRVAALLHHGLGDWEVKCHVYRGLSLAQEAALFRRLNNTRKVTPFDDFDKGLVEGDPDCVGIADILSKRGLRVAPYGNDGLVTCVAQLRKLYVSENGRADGVLLAQALDIAIDAWGVRYDACQKDILAGLAIVHETYGQEIDRAALVNKLAKFPGGASGLLGKARMLREIRTGSVSRLVASVVVGIYNRGRRAGTLGEL